MRGRAQGNTTDISAACHESPVAAPGLRRRSTTTEKNSHANKSEEISTPTYCPTTGNTCCTLTSYFVIKFAIYSFLILSSSELLIFPPRVTSRLSPLLACGDEAQQQKKIHMRIKVKKSRLPLIAQRREILVVP